MTTEFTANAYPPPIYNRSAAGQAAPAARGPAQPPRERHFTVELGAAAVSRRTTSSPRLIGPAIVRRISMRSQTGESPPAQFVELGYSKTPVSESDVAVGAAKPWTKLMERLANPFGFLSQAIVGVWALHNAVSSLPVEFTLDLLVTEADFFLTISLLNHGAVGSGSAILCTVTVLEAVNPEALLNFL